MLSMVGSEPLPRMKLPGMLRVDDLAYTDANTDNPSTLRGCRLGSVIDTECLTALQHLLDLVDGGEGICCLGSCNYELQRFRYEI